MSENTAEPGVARAFVELRRAALRDSLDRSLSRVGEGAAPLEASRAEHLLREAEDLYWNELAWEELTDEELIGGGHLTELVFPGLLAFVEGLLVEKVPDDSLAPANPHPDVVEDVLVFLGERYATFSTELQDGVDSERVVWARAMTVRLIDLVLGRLYGVSVDELEQSNAAG